MYHSLVLGCGARAHWHARAYPEVPGATIAACCELDRERREAFAREYGIPAVYDDYEAALAEAKPQIVHIVTNPSRRVWEVATAAAAGVQAVILEKPIAVKPGDLRELARIRSQYDGRFEIITNSQRRCFPESLDGRLHEIIHERLGELYFVRGSTRGNLMGMGPHLVDWLLCLLKDVPPEGVWAAGAGRSTEGYEATHVAPQHLLAEYWFPRGLRVLVDCDPDALGTPGDTRGFNCHLDFLGSRGRLALSQLGSYWYQAEGMPEAVRHEAADDNHHRGQVELTRQVVRLLSEGTPPSNRFAVSQPVFQALFAAEYSVYAGRRVELPVDFGDEQWEQLMGRLG